MNNLLVEEIVLIELLRFGEYKFEDGGFSDFF